MDPRKDAPRKDDVAALVLGPRLSAMWAAVGAPVRDWWLLSRWTERLADPAAREALGAYFDVLVAQRCVHPGDDLVSDLIDHDLDGGGLTADEIRAVLVDFVRAVAQPV
ncbi:cytochrome P450 [Mycolicibacterium parafortuitum]|uniref:cytochrome P450 n=1 Tax=Mycolicibacterium parafortuitum TaxID=39692 RepID=UPI001E3EBBB8|nr:cytochrome P450 [Mycolicibacterium parafortuitum]